MYPDTVLKPKNVIFNGIKYALLSKGYYLGTSTKNSERKKAKGLHVAIWEDFNGKKVREGFHVHHIDGNTFNNNPLNLQEIEAAEHRKMKKNIDVEKHKKHLESIRPLTKAWHRSEEGRKWHSEHAKNCVRKIVKLECKQCGNEFKAKRKAKFCSRLCGERSRYSLELAKYRKERICEFCNEIFITTKKHEYFKERLTCSYSCSAKRSRLNGKLKKVKSE